MRQERATAALFTIGVSEVARAVTKNCSICGHKLSLHTGEDYVAPTSQPVVVVHQPAAPVNPPPTQGPPAGWYTDQLNPSLQRWWDGTRWTEHTQPVRSEPNG